MSKITEDLEGHFEEVKRAALQKRNDEAAKQQQLASDRKQVGEIFNATVAAALADAKGVLEKHGYNSTSIDSQSGDDPGISFEVSGPGLMGPRLEFSFHEGQVSIKATRNAGNVIFDEHYLLGAFSQKRIETSVINFVKAIRPVEE
jgi:hypothetical protein